MYLPSLAAVSLLLASYVSAKVAITAPVLSTWKAGSKNIITWQDNGEEPKMPAKFDIALMKGKETALALVSTIVKDVDSSLGQYEWEIPATLEPAQDYSIRMGTNPDVSYSAYFEIQSSDGKSGGSTPNTDTKAPAQNAGSTASGTQVQDTKEKSDGLANVATLASGLIVAGSVAFQLL
ncbi:hypothetical protein K493DRAFT_338526 [Basidiobolus meristosporus CBS 931.73]|uniref:Yeast cell wall synthesis Kre9/Knh1-like N-terminal domain-containing protein n=1 Tax=Basidiobolus meristosporus CBS 931.73 TaxID=1314790 RepID=A0A1Y1Y529_9FUNG|nr:hypothetical protein K493DRAFT_338526 [Basidiobolus meristosporus CBS 931.73]|eukprot:ORX93005.1 hypothetical protein K493DRAFT_338526 [Basidiobolus meristosporus CBS 931.73]